MENFKKFEEDYKRTKEYSEGMQSFVDNNDGAGLHYYNEDMEPMAFVLVGVKQTDLGFTIADPVQYTRLDMDEVESILDRRREKEKARELEHEYFALVRAFARIGEKNPKISPMELPEGQEAMEKIRTFEEKYPETIKAIDKKFKR